jgi:hypothetical protein
MTLTATEYRYIKLDERNVPVIEGTSMKIVELITSVKLTAGVLKNCSKTTPT